MRGTKPRLATNPEASLSRAPPVPSYLSKDSKDEWRRVVPSLVAKGIVTSTDLATCESYCIAVGAVREASRTIGKEGLFVNGKAHPAVSVMLRMQNQARLLAAELGLTPMSRSRAAMQGNPDDDQADDADLGV